MNNELAACPGGQFKYLIEEFLDELERRVRHIAERDIEAGRSGDHCATVSECVEAEFAVVAAHS